MARARDLLVIPGVGDDPFLGGWEAAREGWISPVHAAIYPPAEQRRAPQEAPGCPAFGEDSVVERRDRDTPGPDNVWPGLHAFGGDGVESRYDVVWWDPRRLTLDVQRVYGLRREDLIQDPGREVVQADRKRRASSRPPSRSAASSPSSRSSPRLACA